MPPAPDRPSGARRHQLSNALVRGFHAYANWLVSISWKRFFLLAVLWLIAAGVLQSLPPFSWRITETVLEPATHRKSAAKPPKPETPAQRHGVDITIDEHGVRINPHSASADASGPAAGASGPVAAPAAASTPASAAINITLPSDMSDEMREAVSDALAAATESIREIAAAQGASDKDKAEALRDIEQARRDIEQAKRDIAQATHDAGVDLPRRMVERTRTVRWGDFLPEMTFLWIVASAILKIAYKGRIQAEAKAAVATETAESESLKRQVMEARVAAMQAQVEPHFLFNTLASIDHLIETDAPRASRMQKNLIALLRATMPTLREANAEGTRDLGRELAVIRPYLEILKMRMEERLQTRIDIPDGLLSAEFPPMMLQGLVENAIKHGLEPKAEGGSLVVRAEIVHGHLEVSVSDSGLGFGVGTTAGTGVGLANTRERLALLYGTKASLTIDAPPGGGTRATISVPYRSVDTARS